MIRDRLRRGRRYVDHRRGTFGRRLAIGFALVAAVTAALAALMISWAWTTQFNQYVRNNLQVTADGIAQVASEAYGQTGEWSLSTLMAIPRFGPSRGIIVQILDQSGELIYDSTTQNYIHEQMGGQDFTVDPEGPVVTSPIRVDEVPVGTVRVWAYGPSALLTDQDAKFRQGSFTALTVAALLAIALASMGGLWFSTFLVRPIETITQTARALRGGDAHARTALTGDDEIAVLGRAFDEMADAIEADRELERRLTADVAHELRTPLQAIQATVEAMQDGVLPADEEHLGVVRNETVRLARLADAILELTRLERGSLQFDLRPVDPAVPVKSAVDAHAALVEAKELSLTWAFESGMTVLADADRINQAVNNLLANAVRYTPPGGAVDVMLRRDSDCAMILVSDSGIGIDPDDLPHVFDRFWRADAARSTGTGGVGIGLSVTREIVERHKGSISVERRPEGGTRFTIALPLLRESQSVS